MTLKKFIKENELVFGDGERNSNIVTLCGFALWNKNTVEDCKNAIPDEFACEATFKEIERVYQFADFKNYGAWWDNEENRKTYVC